MTVQLTAPRSPGTYAIYARLLAQLTAEDAPGLYESGYPTAKERNYVRIGSLTVPSG